MAQGGANLHGIRASQWAVSYTEIPKHRLGIFFEHLSDSVI